jgi:hypothetical protein
VREGKIDLINGELELSSWRMEKPWEKCIIDSCSLSRTSRH